MPERTGFPMARREFSTGDIEEAHGYLCVEYAEHRPRLSGDREDFGFRATSTHEHRFGFEFVAHSMELRTVVEPYEAILVPHVLKGRIALAGDADEVCAVQGEDFVIPPDGRHSLRWRDLSLGIVRMDPVEVEKVTGVTFTTGLGRPVSAAHSRYWRSVVRHVTRDVLPNPAAIDNPLIRSEAFRLLATAFVETFPVQRAHPAGAEATPAAVRSATEFIDAHPQADLNLHRIAEAVGFSPRALQSAFRRHLDTTPTAYLRQARLQGAHLALHAADPAETTVAEIALNWGFTHHGRFAAAYRRRYGRTPHETLRR